MFNSTHSVSVFQNRKGLLQSLETLGSLSMRFCVDFQTIVTQQNLAISDLGLRENGRTLEQLCNPENIARSLLHL